MAGAIVSANVGGAVAGQVVIPEPRSPSAVTWPDVVQKSIGDIADIFRNREQNKIDVRTEQLRVTQGPDLIRASLFGFPVIFLIVVFFLVRGRLF